VKKFPRLDVSKFKISNLDLILVVVIATYLLSPILRTPFGADDIWMSTLPDRYWYGTESPLGHLKSQSQFWMDAGRLMWVGLLIESFIYIPFDQHQEYKLLLLTLNVFVTAYLYAFLRRYLPNRFGALVGTFAFLGFAQLRPFFDSRIHFTGLLQYQAIAVLFITHLLIKNGKSKSIRKDFVAGLSLMTLLFLYEVPIVLVPAWMFIIFLGSSGFDLSTRLKKIGSFVFPVMIFLGLAWYTRKNAVNSLSSYEINLNPSEVMSTFAIQLLGTFPTLRFYEPIPLAVFELLILSLLLIFTALVIWGSKLHAESKTAEEYRRSFVWIIPIGLSMIVFPSLLISISERWQLALESGLPYISVYLQQLGAALVIAVIFSHLNIKDITKSYIVIVSLVLACGTFILNSTILSPEGRYASSNMIGVEFGWDRETLGDSLMSGKMDKYIDGKELWFYPQQAWTTSEVVSHRLHKKIVVSNSPDWWTNGFELPPMGCTTDECGVDSKDVLVGYHGKSYKSGYVTIIDSGSGVFDAYIGDNGSLHARNAKIVLNNLDDLKSRQIYACIQKDGTSRLVDVSQYVEREAQDIYSISSPFYVDTDSFFHEVDSVC
jgi:hypothetical protein